MASVERHGKGWRAIYTGPDGERRREALPARNKAGRASSPRSSSGEPGYSGAALR